MTSEANDSIKISVTIEIPQGATSPVVSVATPRSAPASTTVIAPAGLTSNSVTITLPKLYPSNYTRVQTVYGATPGICAKGTVTTGVSHVWVNLYSYPMYPSVPPSDPSGVTTKQEATVDTTTGTWQIDNLAASANTSYVICAWASFGGTYVNDYHRIMTDGGGMYTDCTAPASMLRAQAEFSPEALALVPASWSLNSTSFRGPDVMAFNGPWVLNLVASAAQRILYCNGGDGIAVPKVQLSCDSPAASVWKLTFSLGGRGAIYSCAADQFHPQGVNAFRTVDTEGLTEMSSIPALVTIAPA